MHLWKLQLITAYNPSSVSRRSIPGMTGCYPDLVLRRLRQPHKTTISILQSFASCSLRSYTSVHDIDGGRDHMPGAKVETEAGNGKTGRLRLQIVGKFSASVDGSEIDLSRKARALLGYMMLSSARQLPRTKFVGLLWSEKDDPLAKGSLRQSLSEIQRELKALGCTQFHADQLNVTLEIDQVACDAIEVVADAERGVVNPLLLARERVTDSILDDVESVDPAFSDWLAETRPVFHQRLIDALTKILPKENETVVAAAEEAAAKAIYRLDCENERAVRVLIKAHAAAGNIGAALALYARLWRQLEDAYDIEPHKLTQNLIARLRQEQPAGVAPPLFASSTPSSTSQLIGGYESRPSIAVLPFHTPDPADDRYFGEGIVSDIIQSLGGLKELFVISRGSTLRFRGPSPDVRAVSRELGVRYVLYGNVQRSGERLRIFTELVEAETAEILTQKRYEGRHADLFDLQDQIALETAKFIAPEIRERELKRAMRKHPQSMTAYDFVLQALGPLHDLDYATFSRARTLLRRSRLRIRTPPCGIAIVSARNGRPTQQAISLRLNDWRLLQSSSMRTTPPLLRCILT
jgi:TolB-like protein/DNA-binding SARP family transcriptional activator